MYQIAGFKGRHMFQTGRGRSWTQSWTVPTPPTSTSAASSRGTGSGVLSILLVRFFLLNGLFQRGWLLFLSSASWKSPWREEKLKFLSWNGEFAQARNVFSCKHKQKNVEFDIFREIDENIMVFSMQNTMEKLSKSFRLDPDSFSYFKVESGFFFRRLGLIKIQPSY